jgi:hypothetical protein
MKLTHCILNHPTIRMASLIRDSRERDCRKRPLFPPLSFSRKRESMSRKDFWIPAFAGRTERGTFPTVSKAGIQMPRHNLPAWVPAVRGHDGCLV